MAALARQAQVHASSVLNAGRTVAGRRLQADEIPGSRYTIILDGRRCPTCAAADDDVLRPLDDPVRLARVPPNPGCQGGGRCRCIEAFQYRDEQAGDAAIMEGEATGPRAAYETAMGAYLPLDPEYRYGMFIGECAWSCCASLAIQRARTRSLASVRRPGELGCVGPRIVPGACPIVDEARRRRGG